jgi:uncharacterized RDD family membrane protein YckC
MKSGYAGLATRMLAFALDALVINAVAWFVIVVVALGLSLVRLPNAVEAAIVAIGAVVAVLWSIAYFVVFWSTTGQTPGNRVLGIRVERVAGPLTARRALLRLGLLLLSAVPLCAGFLLILFDDRRRALHDRLAGTIVVYAAGTELRTRRPAAPSAS